MQALLSKKTINCGGKLISLDQPKVMGILNTTPDSFFEDSRIGGLNKLLLKVETMLQDGATFIDIGGQSTRPGATLISAQEELERVIPAINALIKEFPAILISIDTFYASVAKSAIEAGASLINDISAGDDDPKMFEVLESCKVPYIMMHKKGLPKSMQENPQYGDVVLEIASYFSAKLEALRSIGVADIILDPGFGFGKNIKHNYQLLNQLSHFKIFELPILVGVSRKSMIQRVLNVDAANALNGSTAVHSAALLNGASILRVHDVKEAIECVKIYEAMKQ